MTGCLDARPRKVPPVASTPSITGIRMSIRIDVRREPPGQHRPRGAVRRLAHHAHVRLSDQDHPEAGSEQRLVVDDQDPDHPPPTHGPAPRLKPNAGSS